MLHRHEWDFTHLEADADANGDAAWSCVFYELARESNTVREEVATVRKLQERAEAEIVEQRAKQEFDAKMKPEIDKAERELSEAKDEWQHLARSVSTAAYFGIKDYASSEQIEAVRQRYEAARRQFSALVQKLGSRLPRGMKELNAANRAGIRLLRWKGRGGFIAGAFANVKGFPDAPWQSLPKTERRVLTQKAASIEPWPEKMATELVRNPAEVRFVLTVNRLSTRGAIQAAAEKALREKLDTLGVIGARNPPTAFRILRNLALTRLRHNLPLQDAKACGKPFQPPITRDGWDDIREALRKTMRELFDLPPTEMPRSDSPFAVKKKEK